jgi:hypothetical protein
MKVAVLHPNPDVRPADVEHGGVEAVDQPPERGFRWIVLGSICGTYSLHLPTDSADLCGKMKYT